MQCKYHANSLYSVLFGNDTKEKSLYIFNKDRAWPYTMAHGPQLVGSLDVISKDTKSSDVESPFW